MEDVTAQLLWIGLSEERAKQTIKNEALTKLLLELIAILRKGGNSDEVLARDVGKLVFLAATTTKAQIRQHLPLVLEYLASKKIDSEAKLAAATEFLLVNPTSVDIQQFEQSAGVGLTVTQQQIADTVKAQIEKNRSELLEKRYRFGLGCILGDLRKDKILRFADGKAIKAEVDAQVLALLGPKNESDNAKPKKEPKEGNKENMKAVDAAVKEEECKDIVELLNQLSRRRGELQNRRLRDHAQHDEAALWTCAHHRWQSIHPISPETKRYSAHWPRQSDQHQLRLRPGQWRPLLPALRRHQPREGGGALCGGHQGHGGVARLQALQDHILLGLLWRAVRLCGDADQEGPCLHLPQKLQQHQQTTTTVHFLLIIIITP